MRTHELCVLHVAALGDRDALDMLCRATPVISAAGVGQVLLLLDEGDGAEPAWAAWRAVAAEMRRLQCAGLSIFGKVRALKAELVALLHESASLYAVHLHGLGPCLLGSRALMGGALRVRVICSPHGHAASALGTFVLGRLLQRQLSALNYAALAASLTEAEALSRLLHRSADLLLRPVHAAFFAASRREDARPVVAAGGSGHEAIDLVTRLCVLLNGRDLRVRFAWLGATDEGARAALQAANVELDPAVHDGERAQALSRASVFLHVSPGDGLPLAAAQAMAAGVPCLVSDTPAHRSLIRHGVTGYVCTSERDFLEKLVLLLRDPGERSRLGESARAEAERCFAPREYERAVLRAYGFSALGRSVPSLERTPI